MTKSDVFRSWQSDHYLRYVHTFTNARWLYRPNNLSPSKCDTGKSSEMLHSISKSPRRRIDQSMDLLCQWKTFLM